MPASWKWWEEKQRWEIVFDQMCEKIKAAGHEPTAEEITTTYRAEYGEIYWRFQNIEELLDKVVWRVWGRKRTQPIKVCTRSVTTPKAEPPGNDLERRPLGNDLENGLPGNDLEASMERIGQVVVMKVVKAAIKTVWEGVDEVSKNERHGKRYTKEQALETLRELTAEYGRIPKQIEAQSAGVAWRTLVKYLGPRAGWDDLLKGEESAGEAGLPEVARNTGAASLEKQGMVTNPEDGLVPVAGDATKVQTEPEMLELSVTGTANLKVKIGGREMQLRVKLGEMI